MARWGHGEGRGGRIELGVLDYSGGSFLGGAIVDYGMGGG